MIYPEFVDSFWSFAHALRFIGKKAAMPPVGLLTVAAMLPEDWEKKLVDLNVEKLDGDMDEWPDIVMVSAMNAQKDSAVKVTDHFSRRGVTVMAGGPLFSNEPGNGAKPWTIFSLERPRRPCRFSLRTSPGGCRKGLPAGILSLHGENTSAGPEADKTEEIQHHGHSILQGLPTQLRLLQHYIPLRQEGPHEDNETDNS